MKYVLKKSRISIMSFEWEPCKHATNQTKHKALTAPTSKPQLTLEK